MDFRGVPKYQDAAIKFNFPSKKAGAFSLFGMGGLSSITEEDSYQREISLRGGRTYDATVDNVFDLNNHLYTAGINHVFPFNKNTFLETTVAYSSSGIKENETENRFGSILNAGGISMGDSTTGKFKTYETNFMNSSLITCVKLSSKLNAKNKIEVGIKNIYNQNDYYEEFINSNTSKELFTSID